MIKINNVDIITISETYFSKIKTDCLERASFYVDVCNVLFHGSPSNILLNHTLNGNTKRSLVNLLLLPAHQLHNQNSYHTVTLGNCKAWVTPNQHHFEQISAYLNVENNLKAIILCKPENCHSLDQNLMGAFGLTLASGDVISFITQILDYKMFKKYAYEIGKSIGLNTCPYCNRSFIHTVYDHSKNEIIRPEFDHFFPQSLHPFLGLSFFNLIPSCYYCNSSLKHATVISPDTHMHPYLEGFDNDVFFYIKIDKVNKQKSDPSNYKIKLMTNPGLAPARLRKIMGNTNTEGNVNLFKLNEIYPSHLDIVGELIVKCDKYSSWYSGPFLKLFGLLLSTNKTEFYQYYFGNYFNEKDFHRRPLAKMTKDIIRQVLPEFMK